MKKKARNPDGNHEIFFSVPPIIRNLGLLALTLLTGLIWSLSSETSVEETWINDHVPKSERPWAKTFLKRVSGLNPDEIYILAKEEKDSFKKMFVLRYANLRENTEAGIEHYKDCMGLYYQPGMPPPPDEDDDFNNYLLASAAYSLYILSIQGVEDADVYFFDLFREVDHSVRAWEHLNKALENEVPLAYYRMGELFESGKSGVDKNMEEAMNCYLLAAEGGHVPAANRLAHEYITGNDVPTDIPAALRWLGMAQCNGHERAGQLRDAIIAELNFRSFFPDPRPVWRTYWRWGM